MQINKATDQVDSQKNKKKSPTKNTQTKQKRHRFIHWVIARNAITQEIKKSQVQIG